MAALVLLLAATHGLQGQRDSEDLAAVKEFLKKAHARKKWQSGPKQVTGDAIAKAYGADQKFYYVFSAPPLPPGANIPELIKAFRARYKDYQDNYISATLRIDAARKVSPLRNVVDYN
ncbi:MAG: hypothetical protein FJ271_19350 [Planctomycetes bacterium]|nr:hypothetical protein [Planctomycetota bacterium]